MSKESPIYVAEAQFCVFTNNDKKMNGDEESCGLVFDGRHDFLVDKTATGIAARIVFCNDRQNDPSPKGVRRMVSLTLIDCTTRCVLERKEMKVCMRKDTAYKTVYMEYRLSDDVFRGCRTCRLLVRDEGLSQVICEQIIHLFDSEELGHPSEWYSAESGGVMTMNDKIYRSVNCRELSFLRVHFDLEQKFGRKLPMIFPEVELRLHFPDSDQVSVRYVEPKCVDFGGTRCVAEQPFYTSNEHAGAYYAELLCMGYSVAGFVFNISECEIDGVFYDDELSAESGRELFERLAPKVGDIEAEDFDALLDRFISSELDEHHEDEPDDKEEGADDAPTVQEEKKTESVMPEICLEHLTGINEVKSKLQIYERLVRFNKMRSDIGLPHTETPLHAMFLGSPGTGKTTVAKMMGAMLHRAGILSKGHVVVRERATLLGQNYSSESEKTLASLEEARGGILFIDEAYQLYQPNDPRDPGKFVIETLLTALADESNRDWMLVLAGYPKEMKQMFEMNPGFKSRIPESNVYFFKDFTEPELMEIAEKYLTRFRYTLTPDARVALADRLREDYLHRDSEFGNARHVINMIQTEVLPAMAVRVTTDGLTSEAALTEIQQSDIVCHVTRECKSRPRVGFAV